MTSMNPSSSQSNHQSRMSNFMERISSIATPDRDFIARTFRSTQSLEFLKVTNDVEAAQIALTGLMLCNEKDIGDAQACAHYLSALSAVFPGLEATAKKVLSLIGYNVREVTSELNLVTILEWIETPRLAVMIGQAIVILYKHISEPGYDRFIKARTRGLKAHAGCTGQLTASGDVVFPIAKARMIRGRLGAFQFLRAEVLHALLANRNQLGPFGGICSYLCDILAWTEMAFMVFIFDTLCLTKSPVLRDWRVQGEVRALCTAYMEINKTDSPQYFKILFPTSATNVILRSKFPILIAVAQTCKAQWYDTVSQYISTTPSTNTLVAELVEIHNQYMSRNTVVAQSRHFNYLTKVDPDDEEMTGAAAPE